MSGLSSHPLAAQWHPTKNGVLSVEDVSLGSDRKVWWLGPCGHEWEAGVRSRVGLGAGCGVCAGKVLVPGVNDFASKHPDLAVQWHPTRNTVDPSGLFSSSTERVWWLCGEGHEWVAPVVRRVQGKGNCRECASGLRRRFSAVSPVLFGFLKPAQPVDVVRLHRSYRGVLVWVCGEGHETQKPAPASGERFVCGVCERVRKASGNPLPVEWVAQWHPTKNLPVVPGEVSTNSNRPVWWVCPEGHEWLGSPNRRSQGRGCAVCVGKQIMVGVNDLASTHPEVAAQWDPDSQDENTPHTLTAGSNKTLSWVGLECSHRFKMTVYSFIHQGGCPVCRGLQIMVGVNDLETTHSHLVQEWHPTRNGDLTPKDVTAGSTKPIWWKCAQGHEWQAVLYSRTGNHNNGCPDCNRARFVSQAEGDIAAFITGLGFEVKQSDRSVLSGQEIDIYIPERKVGVEFNGLFWHNEAAGKGKRYHEGKYLAAKKAGVQLIQVWEDDWNRDPDLVKRVLAHKLGVSTQPAVYARKTRVEALTTRVTKPFLGQNHIQGFASGSYYVGLRDIETEVLVAVMVLKNEPGHVGTLNIVRYATSTRVPGGFTKLLKFAEKEYKPSRFITFSDHCISDGGLYEGNGFMADKVLDPDYMYVVGNERKHKFGYRLKKFRNDPALKYVEGLTERELAALNGLPRVWDAGKTRYVKHLS